MSARTARHLSFRVTSVDCNHRRVYVTQLLGVCCFEKLTHRFSDGHGLSFGPREPVEMIIAKYWCSILLERERQWSEMVQDDLRVGSGKRRGSKRTSANNKRRFIFSVENAFVHGLKVFDLLHGMHL